MDAQSMTEIAGMSAEVRKILAEVKTTYGAIEKTASDFSARWEQAKAEVATKAEVQVLLNRIHDVAARDQDNRNGSMVQRVDYSVRTLREVILKCSPEEAKATYDLFLTSQPINSKISDLHYYSARVSMLQAIMRKRDRTWNPSMIRTPRGKLLWREYVNLAKDILGEDVMTRAFDTTEVSEWVPTILSTELIKYIEHYGGLIPALINFDMPAGLYNVPITTGANVARYFPEYAGLPSGGFDYSTGPLYANNAVPTDKIAFDAERMRTWINVTGDLQEESVIPMLPWALGETGSGVRRALETACINGGTANQEPDYDNSSAAAGDGSKDARQAWDGIRRAIKVNNTAGRTAVYDAATTEGGKLTMKGVTEALILMDRYAVPEGTSGTSAPPVYMLSSMKGYLDLLDMPEYLTVDAAGARATNVTGAVGAVLGIPVIISEYQRKDVSATGFNTVGGPNTKTSYVMFHRGTWALGTFRGIWTEQERLAGYDQNVVWAWWKGDFQKLRAATVVSEVAVINVS